jgi:polyisoprenoid-binding protein YceI
MFKYAVLLASLTAVIAMAIPGKPVVPAGAWRVDAGHSSAQLVTDGTTNYGKSKVDFTLGFTRVNGTVALDSSDPAKSAFDFRMYPANSMAPPIDEEGKVKLEWFANLANHTLVCFHSKGFTLTPTGRLQTTGNLTLTRVDRNIEFNPTEAYSGPTYGPPMIHHVSRDATFVFIASPDDGTDGKNTKEILSGSTSMAREDFPQLFKTVFSTNWPPVVQDEQCQNPSVGAEDYSGPKCTGTFLHAHGLPQEPRDEGIGEDFPAHSDFSAVVGQHLTIYVRMHLRPASKQQAAAD